MTELMFMGLFMTVLVAVVIALLTRAIWRTRISRGAGILIVISACLLWHGLAWASLDWNVGFIHHVLIVSIIVPFGFGFGEGPVAFVIALAVQTIVAASIAAGVYLLFRRDRCKHPADV